MTPAMGKRKAGNWERNAPGIQNPEYRDVLPDEREVLVLSRELRHTVRDVLDDVLILFVDIILRYPVSA